MKHANDLKPTNKKGLTLNKRTVMRITLYGGLRSAEGKGEHLNKLFETTVTTTDDTLTTITTQTSVL